MNGSPPPTPGPGGTGMRKRTRAREAALQALYQWEVRGEAFEAELEAFLAEWAPDREAADFARELVLGCRMWREELDRVISAAARHWSLDRMARVDRNILRLAAYELLYREDIPPKVAINEAVDLAKKFSTADSGAFVNGILDRIKPGDSDARARDAPG